MRRWALRVGMMFTMSGCAAAPTPLPVAPKAARALPVATTRPVAKVVEAPPVQDGPGLTPEQVSSVLVTRSLAVGGCHAVEYSGRSPEPGFIVVDLAIRPDGHVRSARVSDSSYAQGEFPQCVASVTRDLSFPPASGETEVSWRFDFHGR